MEGLYAILDVPHPFGLNPLEVARALLGDRPAGGIDGAAVLQLRAKGADTNERVRLLTELAPLCRSARVPLIINDDVAALLRAGPSVDGLHLGQGDPGCDDIAAIRREVAHPVIIGISTHDIEQLRAAGKLEPDYIAYGPVLATRSKANPDPVVGFSGLLDACRRATRPLVAIGGLDESSAVRAVEVGAHAVAVISALTDRTLEGVRARSQSLAAALRRAAQPLAFEEVCKRVPVVAPELITQLAAWSDDLGVIVALGLPARFRPRMVQGIPHYRARDVDDLLYALGKRPDEDWALWERRISSSLEAPPLVQLRTRA